MYSQINRQETEQFERRAVVAALRWLCDPLRTMENLKTGDTVQLKSGGPIMTVGAPHDQARVNCDWFEGGALKHGVFYVEQLKKAEPVEDGPYIA